MEYIRVPQKQAILITSMKIHFVLSFDWKCLPENVYILVAHPNFIFVLEGSF